MPIHTWVPVTHTLIFLIYFNANIYVICNVSLPISCNASRLEGQCWGKATANADRADTGAVTARSASSATVRDIWPGTAEAKTLRTTELGATKRTHKRRRPRIGASPSVMAAAIQVVATHQASEQVHSLLQLPTEGSCGS